MKKLLLIFVLAVLNVSIYSQNNEEINETEISAIAPATEQGNNLELAAVLELFKDSKDLADFEKKLNDEENGVNNLDLNGDSLIDYIRVLEQEDGKYRVIILQAVIGDNEYQDVATINVEHISDDKINIQAQGDEEIYGENYYVEPPAETHVHIHLWPIWPVIFAPHYVIYRSPYYWHHYPPYWRPFRPVPFHVYHSRRIVVAGRGGFYYTRRAVVVRPPVYRRHYSSRVVVRPNNHRNSYTRNNTGNYRNKTNSRNPNTGRNPNNNIGRTPNKTRDSQARQTRNTRVTPSNRAATQKQNRKATRQTTPANKAQKARTQQQRTRQTSPKQRPQTRQTPQRNRQTARPAQSRSGRAGGAARRPAGRRR